MTITYSEVGKGSLQLGSERIGKLSLDKTPRSRDQAGRVRVVNAEGDARLF